MAYSSHKRKENEGVPLPNFEHHFQSSLQSSFSIPAPQNQSPKHVKFGQWVVDQRWVTPDQLSVALKEQTRSHKRLGEVMLDLGFLSTEQLLKALSTLSGFSSISLANQILNLSVVQQIPFEIAKRHQLILFEENNKVLHVAMADPEDLLALDKIRNVLGSHIRLIPYHATLDGISHALEIYYPQPLVDTQDGEVVRLVNDLILEAVRLKASDIHLSPTAHRIDVQYRRDGLLYQAHTLHKERWSAISVRLKIMGSLDIAESRRPQNGRFSLTLGGREIDFRLACHPTIYGEKMVLRILDKTQSLRSLDELGFNIADIETIKRLVQLPQGMIILSGPTGAGKTTTLYGLLSYMDALTRNIMTLEEPVEYYLPNIHQTEIREGGSFRFAEGVRSLLRQDPDVIFISEIRDAETAQMALRASMTGHLILGTIHARDSFTVPQRFLDLGIASSLLSGNLVASIAQRLVRRLCEACRQPKIVTLEDRQRLALPKSTTHVYQAIGCSLCLEGYVGREAVSELVLFDEDLSAIIAEGSAQSHLRKIAKCQGLPTLWDRGIEKVLAGKTTLAEIDRVIGTYH
jgi:type II secretory ATPase GspE/PulE/Tfp pilus assembly ATPase PilB-like protein